MKAITLTQPWATLVELGIKRVETRSWSTSYRGPLLIHAAKGKPDRGFEAALKARGILPADLVLPLGAIVARCRLQFVGSTTVAFAALDADSPERELGDFGPGRYGWSLTRVERLPEPIPWRGALGLWDGPDLDLEGRVA